MKIPFYENLKDNNHCFQACIKMALGYFLPQQDFSYDYLDEISSHDKEKWTWQGLTLIKLAEMGFSLVNIENIDYSMFAKEGPEYLKRVWPKDVYETQKKFSDLSFESKVAGKLVKNKNIKLINKEAQLDDVKFYFDKGYVVLVSVNPCVFSGDDGYYSHMVVITDINEDEITFHDPGLPPIKNRKVPVDIFVEAMTSPRKPDANIIAIRK